MTVSLPKRIVRNLNFTGAQEYDVINSARFIHNFPAAADFAGPYVIAWTGTAIVQFNWGGVAFTIDSGQSTSYTQPFADRISAMNPRIVFSWNSGQALRNAGNVQVLSGTATGLRIYRLEDETDFIAGRYFRRGNLNLLAQEYPSAVRYMNWYGGNDSHHMRWEHRSKLTDTNWSNFVTSGGIATYGTTSGTNIYTLAGIGSTPVAMQHGEVVQCTIGAGVARGGANTVTGVTKANPGVVTYSGTDNYQNGDKVVWRVTTGMTELDYRICAVANVNTGANTFELSGLDTSGFTTWSSGVVMQYISLDVGSRGAYPVVFSDGITGAANYGTYLSTNDIKAFYFDKGLIAAKNEATGVAIQGAWIFNNVGSNVHRAGVPPALLAAHCIELNEAASALGKGRIGIWVNVPHRGMSSMDADYSAGSNVAVGLVGLLINGGDGVAAIPSDVPIYVELTNEVFNVGGGFIASTYFTRLGALLSGTVLGREEYHALRHAVMVSDIRAAFPNDLDRIVFVIAGQGTLGVSAGNVTLMDGTASLAANSTYQSIGGGAAGTNHQFWDAFAMGSYLSPTSAFNAANLSTLVTTYTNGDAEDKEQAITDYMVGALGSGSSETLSRYRDTLLPAYNTKMISLDRVVIGYEGGNEFGVTGTINDQYSFLYAAKASQQWADLYRTWFDKWRSLSNAAMPGEYIMIQSISADHRWDHIKPGESDTYSDGVEGGSLDLSWEMIRDYNNNRRSVRLTATA